MQSSLRANLICNLKHEKAFAYYDDIRSIAPSDAKNRQNGEKADVPDSKVGTRISERCNPSATKTNDANT